MYKVIKKDYYIFINTININIMIKKTVDGIVRKKKVDVTEMFVVGSKENKELNFLQTLGLSILMFAIGYALLYSYLYITV